jgi:hypothetical protein
MLGFHKRREYFYQLLLVIRFSNITLICGASFLLSPTSFLKKIRARSVFYQQRANHHLSRNHIWCSVKCSLVKAMTLLDCTQQWKGSACSIYLRSAVVPTKPLIHLQLYCTKAEVSLTNFRVRYSWHVHKKILVNMMTEAMNWVLASCMALFNFTHSLCRVKMIEWLIMDLQEYRRKSMCAF